QATRISVTFLEALESGQIDKLPGQVFGRGFLRSICSTMQVSPDPFLLAFDLCWEGESLTAPPQVKAKASSRESDAPKKAGLRIKIPTLRWELVAGTAIVVAAIGVSLYVERS